MKPTTLTALALTLLMLLLVLLAAFFFVFQGQLTLRDDLANANQTVDSLEADRAKLELEHSGLLATATRLSAAQATSETENAALGEQLVQTDIRVTELAQENASVENELDVAMATRDLYEMTGPLVRIIDPRPGATATAGEEMILIIVASDVTGVKTVTISIDNELIELPPLSPDKIVTVRQPWTPENAGQMIITVTAINSNDVTSQPAAITVPVNEPEPTSTATPTITPTATPTAEPTAAP